MYVCPCCYATDPMGAPHGTGTPCPTAVALTAAQIRESNAHTDLMKAQRDATILASGSR